MPLPDMSEIQFSAIRSRGPGGQNVNKVSSAAQMHWDFQSSNSFSEIQKGLIAKKLSRVINKEGQVYLRSDEFRDLERNKDRCLEKLSELLKEAFHKPRPRKKTKPTKASQRKRIESKKQRGETKKYRQKVKL